MRKFWIAIAAACLTDCGAAVDRPSTNRAGATWSVDSIPLLDVGGSETSETFGDVSGAGRLPDGGVVVADRVSAALRYFDNRGTYVRSVGRKGSGPGEFEYLAWMLHCGDSLYISDISTRKVSVFSDEGTYARQFVMQGDTVGQLPYHTACNADGVFLNNGWDMSRVRPNKSGRTRGVVPYWTSTANGEVRSRLGKHAWAERWMTISPSGGGGSRPLPLGRNPVLAAGRTRLYIGTADSFLVNVFALDGSPKTPVQKAVRLRATQPEDIERYKLLDTLGKKEQDKRYQEQYWAGVEFPLTLPPYTALIVDSDEHLWVRDFPPAKSESVAWSIFSPDGVEVAHIQLPVAFTVHEIGRDYVLGNLADVASGVKRVQVLRLHRGR